MRKSRNKMRKSVNIILPKISATKHDKNSSKNNKISKVNCFSSNKNKTNAKNQGVDAKKVESLNAPLLKTQKSNRNRQENQLTWMTIAVAILYLVTSIPMVFAYPGLIFRYEFSHLTFRN